MTSHRDSQTFPEKERRHHISDDDSHQQSAKDANQSHIPTDDCASIGERQNIGCRCHPQDDESGTDACAGEIDASRYRDNGARTRCHKETGEGCYDEGTNPAGCNAQVAQNGFLWDEGNHPARQQEGWRKAGQDAICGIIFSACSADLTVRLWRKDAIAEVKSTLDDESIQRRLKTLKKSRRCLRDANFPL